MMHKMSTTMHKSEPSKIGSCLKSDNRTSNGSLDAKNNQNELTRENMKTSKVAVIDIERENRLSKVISLYRKGLNQEEIAQELHVDQSTIPTKLIVGMLVQVIGRV
jgi:DNA-binding NarL/FixJ family response regulator